jgi:glutathione S-transferase
MIELHGFAASNYHNKVKLALLEKAVPFTEVLNWAGKDEQTLAMSPMGKVPFLKTEQGTLSESQVQLEYLEQRFAQPALIPADPWQAAKVRELCTYLDVHLELVVRRIYPQAFFGKTVAGEVVESTEKELKKAIAAFGRLARFSPFVAGDMFTMADCCAIVHLPLISMATKAVYGEDLLAALPAKDYLKQMAARPSVQLINAERKANQELMMQQRAK